MLGIFISQNLISLNSVNSYSNIIILFRYNYLYIILSEMLIVQNFFYVSKPFGNQISYHKHRTHECELTRLYPNTRRKHAGLGMTHKPTLKTHCWKYSRKVKHSLIKCYSYSASKTCMLCHLISSCCYHDA